MADFQRAHQATPRDARLVLTISRLCSSVNLIKIPVTEKGTKRLKRKRDVVAAQLVNKAAAGDLRAINLLLTREDTQVRELPTHQGSAADNTIGAADREVLDDFLQRMGTGGKK